MSKDHKILPKLRFPEFESDGEFREKSLGYFCDYWNGSGNESGVTEDGQYLLISLNSIDIEGNLKSDMKRVPSTDNSLKKGDLVMVLSDVAHGNFLGLSAIIPDDNYVLNQRMAGLGIKDFSEIDPKYLRLFINGNQKYFKRQGQGSSQQNLSKGSVIDFPVLVPTRLIEQQKIASCLSSLDELIAAHKDKLDALKDHKKGLLQNLFPQEGETVPKLRFPEFEGDGEWVENQLQEHCHNISSGKDKNQDDGKIDLYGSTGIIGKTENESYEGDYILVARVGANAGLLNRAIGKFGVTDNTLIINLKEPEMVDFIFYSLDKIGLNKLVFGSGQPLVTGKQLKELNIPIPKNPKEQQKIASCLSAVDELIIAQQEKIDELQQHKKGLMQGLFPKIES
jgi:type I restriction enzyme S subunit